jgi:hypothetical protein
LDFLKTEVFVSLPNMPDPKQLADAIGVFQQEFAKSHSATVNESARSQLNMLAAKFQQASAEVLALYPQEMAKLQQRQESIKSRAAEMMAKVAQMREQMAAAEAVRNAPPPPPKPIEEALEPGLSQKLRAELLERFGGVAKGKIGAARPGRRDFDQLRFPPKAPETHEPPKKEGSWQ